MTQALATLRRQDDKTCENSTAFGATTDITLRPSAMSTLGGGLGFERQVEDRGDPESRPLTDIGPRRLNDFSGNAFSRLKGERVRVQDRRGVPKVVDFETVDVGPSTKNSTSTTKGGLKGQGGQ